MITMWTKKKPPWHSHIIEDNCNYIYVITENLFEEIFVKDKNWTKMLQHLQYVTVLNEEQLNHSLWHQYPQSYVKQLITKYPSCTNCIQSKAFVWILGQTVRTSEMYIWFKLHIIKCCEAITMCPNICPNSITFGKNDHTFTKGVMQRNFRNSITSQEDQTC